MRPTARPKPWRASWTPVVLPARPAALVHSRMKLNLPIVYAITEALSSDHYFVRSCHAKASTVFSMDEGRLPPGTPLHARRPNLISPYDRRGSPRTASGSFEIRDHRHLGSAADINPNSRDRQGTSVSNQLSRSCATTLPKAAPRTPPTPRRAPPAKPPADPPAAPHPHRRRRWQPQRPTPPSCCAGRAGRIQPHPDGVEHLDAAPVNDRPALRRSAACGQDADTRSRQCQVQRRSDATEQPVRRVEGGLSSRR